MIHKKLYDKTYLCFAYIYLTQDTVTAFLSRWLFVWGNSKTKTQTQVLPPVISNSFDICKNNSLQDSNFLISDSNYPFTLHFLCLF